MAEALERLVLVTGAASGVGAATARHLHARGARLIVMDRDSAGLTQFEDARQIVGDVADPDLWAEVDLAGLTHAVVNAGIADGGTAIADLPFADWRRVLTVNLDGSFLTLSAAMRAIRATGKGGAIVVTGSVSGIKAQPNTAAYSASKAALVQLARVAALEGAPDKIRVNCIAPGGVTTPIWSVVPDFQKLAGELGGDDAAFDAMGKAAAPLGRYANADEIARQIAFLLSEDSAIITGACLVADGGYSL